MNLQEHVSLAPFTTFGVGGEARFFIEAHTDSEVEDAIAYAHERALSLYILGAGSNILVPDDGVDGVVLKMSLQDIAFENAGDNTLLIADAGAPWEKVVDVANERCMFGIENLAGIPGTVGGAVVQNIGAYGAELADVFEYADVISSVDGTCRRISRDEAAFAYRTSFFKEHREYIILRAALRLSKSALPNLTYPDLARMSASGTPLATPTEITSAIRAIRATKFPLAGKGTAGSFFKNPITSAALASSLAQNFPGLPVFTQEGDSVKISLAWLLDQALSLKGFSKDHVRLYEHQPLVIVASTGATAAEVDAFANEIAGRVFKATGIMIEREVEMFGTQK
ncbi:MAG: UDP-N-acetylmuramate dehydrogenase [Candidatus Paceibacterota bacterium]|jgi:UDP-N-acetylmuramate dehydrogenase